MKTYDWIVIGGGIGGVALSYELARQGLQVLLIEQSVNLTGASRFSYGGVAYWAGTTPLTRQLGAESFTKYEQLSDELESEIQFRVLDLVMTIPVEGDVTQAAHAYAHCAAPPSVISPVIAKELEPQLNPDALGGALTCRHGHIEPMLTVEAYRRAAETLGVEVVVAKVETIKIQDGLGDRYIQGVNVHQVDYPSQNVIIAAGGLSRWLLSSVGVNLPIYFTHAELIEIAPMDPCLRTLVLPAQIQRVGLETLSSRPEFEHFWDQPGHEPMPSILDPGGIQFCNGRLLLGQISRTLTDPQANLNPSTGEMAIRTAIGEILPALKDVAGTWHRCLVAFSRDQLPLVGKVPGYEGLHVFSGFSNPLTLIPPVAQRFAAHVAGTADDLIVQLHPGR